MEPKRPQLNLEDLLRIKWLLGGGLILLSISTVLYLDIEAWTLMGLTALAVGLVMVKPGLPARLPAAIHWLAFPAIVAFFLGDIYLTTEVLPALVRLDILLLLYRGITYRQRRDDLQLIVLGLFLIVLAGVLTVSLLFAVQILAFVACALIFLLVITLVDAAGGDRLLLSEGSKIPTWARGSWRGLWGRMRAATDWRIAVLGAGLFGGLVVLSALLFLAIPRFELENSLFLERYMTKKARTGFSDQIKFGDVTDIQQDNGVAVSIDVSDPSKIPAQPYWRMVVLDEYRDESFRLSATLRRDAFSGDRTDAALRGQARPQLGEPVYWTFYMEAGVSRYLPLAGHFEMMRFRERQNFYVASSLGLVILRDEPVSMTAYRVEGMKAAVELGDPKFGEHWKQQQMMTPAEEPITLRLRVSAEDREKLKGVLKQIIGADRPTTEEFARQTSAWLATRHSYGLRSRTPTGAGDALVRWLDSNEPGHCELFAGAMVLLARSAGIPARVITGFRGGSWNGFSNNFTLRNADAHAWTELFDEAAQAWIRVDPTPGSAVLPDAKDTGLSALDTRQIDRSWTARFDSLRIFWYRRIVNFDQRSQVETIKTVKSATQRTMREFREWMQSAQARMKTWLAAPWSGGRWVKLLGVAILSAGGIWLAGFVVLLMRRRAWRWRRGPLHPVRAEAGRWLRRLRGYEAGAELIADLERLRYGPETSWPETAGVLTRARQAWRRVRRGKINSS